MATALFLLRKLGQGRHNRLAVGDDGEIGPFHTISAWRSVLTASTRSQRAMPCKMLRRAGDAEGENSQRGSTRLPEAPTGRSRGIDPASQTTRLPPSAAAQCGRHIVEAGPIGDAIAGD